MNDVTIREATTEDVGLILRFITELAIYEKAEHEVVATEASIQSSLFGENSNADALICSQGNNAIGFAVYFYTYSTWQGKKGLYLEDLYVTPEARGLGAGKMLLQKLAQIAVDNDCGRYEWSVLDWNTPSIEFYEKMGAVAQSEWIRYRMDGETLEQFAGKKKATS